MTPSQSPDPIVRAEGVTRSFGSVKALTGVDLSFEPGIIYGLLGPNGAGKTTLIRILSTLLRPDEGRVEIGGVDVLTDPTAARRLIGLAGQFAAVDDFLTGRENVEMVGRLYQLSSADAAKRTNELLERIDLIEAADRPVKTYSGGMRRRLDLAASMIGRPTVLFLDEPTTGIDPRSRIDIWELVEDLVKIGTTILLTTQYLEEADRLADRIAVIDHGRIITEGTSEELKDELGTAVVELAVDRADQERTLQVLGDRSDSTPGIDERTGLITLPATTGAKTLLDVVRVLDDTAIVPLDIALRRPTLDDVFLELTGRPVEETPKAPKRRRSR